MRLVIQRSQQAIKGTFGGHRGMKFTLDYRLELTAEETELVRHYKLGNYPLTTKSVNGVDMPDDTVAKLIEGQSQTVTDVTTLLQNERVIKNACDDIPVLFDVCRSFGGSEVIEYPRVPAGE